MSTAKEQHAYITALTSQQIADAFVNAANSESCALRGCDFTSSSEDAPAIRDAGIVAVSRILAPIIADQQRLEWIIKFSATWTSRDEIDRRIAEATA